MIDSLWRTFRRGARIGLVAGMIGVLPVAQGMASGLVPSLVAALDAADKEAFLAQVARIARSPRGPAYAGAVAGGLAPWLAPEVAVAALIALPPDIRAGAAPTVLAAVLIAVKGRMADAVRQAVAAAVPAAPPGVLRGVTRRLSVRADGQVPLAEGRAADQALAAARFAAHRAGADLRAAAAAPAVAEAEDTPGQGRRGVAGGTPAFTAPSEPLPTVPPHLLPSGS